MSCQLRQLHNKDVIITTLLKQRNVTCDEKIHVIDRSVVGYIRTLNDLCELNLARNPVHSSQKQGATARDGTYIDKHKSDLIFLISGLKMNGSNDFYGLLSVKRRWHEVQKNLLSRKLQILVIKDNFSIREYI